MAEDWQNTESWARAQVLAGHTLTPEQGHVLLDALDEARRDAHQRQAAADLARTEADKLRALATLTATAIAAVEDLAGTLREAGIKPFPDACPVCEKPQAGHCDDCHACPGDSHEDFCGLPTAGGAS